MSFRPTTPVFSRAQLQSRENCYNCECSDGVILTSGGSGKETEVLPGIDITIDDLSTSTKNSFVVNYSPYVGLIPSLSLVAKASDIVKTNPVLKGTTIDEVDFTWSYNKAVTAQTLSNDGGITAPTLQVIDRTYSLTEQAIISNTAFTIQGNDGAARSGSVASSTKSISFGNYFAHGVSANKINGLTTSLQAIFDGLENKEVKTSRGNSIYPEGTTNEHHIIFYPKAWGEATFKKGIFIGGYVRLKNVAGTLKVTLGGGEVETDISINNGNGYSEVFYVYQSLNDLQEDNVTPVEVS